MEPASRLQFRLFGKGECVFDVNAEVADCALDLGVAERS